MYKNECIVCGKQFSNKAESRLRQAMTIHMNSMHPSVNGSNNALITTNNVQHKKPKKYRRNTTKSILSGSIHSIDTSKADLYKDLLRRCLMELGL